MWIQVGTWIKLIPEYVIEQKNRATSDARYGAILLYLLRNRQREDWQAISDIVNRIPKDLVLCQDCTVYRKAR